MSSCIVLIKYKKIALIGMMGAGKSTVGRLLADKLCYKFFDTDRYIEETLQCSISEIFHSVGEIGFREIEQRVILQLCAEYHDMPHVMALGGGALINLTRQFIESDYHVIWLQATIPALTARLYEQAQNRPMIQQGNNIEETLKNLTRQRNQAYYAVSHCTLDTTNITPNTSLDKIISIITTSPCAG